MEHRFWCPLIVFQTIDLFFFFLLHFTRVHSVVLFGTRNSEHYTSAMICAGVLGLNLYSHLQIYDKKRKSISPSTYFFSRTLLQGSDTDNETSAINYYLFLARSRGKKEKKSVSQAAIVWAQISRNQADNRENCLDILSPSSLTNGSSYTEWWCNGFMGFFPPEEPRRCIFPSANYTKKAGYRNGIDAVGERVNFLPIMGPLSR